MTEMMYVWVAWETIYLQIVNLKPNKIGDLTFILYIARKFIQPIPSAPSHLTVCLRESGSSLFSCYDLFQSFHQFGNADGLSYIIIHANREAHLAVALHGVGSHGNDVRPILLRPARKCNTVSISLLPY